MRLGPNRRLRLARSAPVVAALLLVPLAPLSALSQSGTKDTQAARLYEDALVRYEKRDLPGAIIQLKNALQIDRNQLPVQILLGTALLESSDVVAAEVAFNEALRLGVNRAEVVLPHASALKAQGKFKELLEDPRFAPDGLPSAVRTSLLLLRASAYSDQGNAKDALRSINEARQSNPTSADSWLSEVPIRLRAREFAQAASAADRALVLAPDSAEAQFLRGSVAHVQGQVKPALAAYDRALALQANHVETLLARAGLLLDQGRHAEAASDVETLRKQYPKEPRGAYLSAMLADRAGQTAAVRVALNDISALLDPVPLEQLRHRPQMLMLGGMAHYGLGQMEKAKPYLEALQRILPSSPASKLMAQMQLADGNVDRAIESLEAYLAATPSDGQAVALLASAYIAKGRHPRATQLLERALASQDSPRLRAALGLSLLGGGKLADATPQLEAAYKNNPALVQAGAGLVPLYLHARQPKKAVATAESLVKRQPGNPGFHNLLGLARAQGGDAAGARSAFEQALKLDPKFVEPGVNLARLEINIGSMTAAAARLDQILRTHDAHVEALIERGMLAARMGQTSDATRWLETAADHSPRGDLRAGLRLVEHHIAGGRPAAAKEAAARLSIKVPDAVPVLIAQARASLASKDAADARVHLTRASRTAQFDAPQLVQIAMLQLSAGDAAGAGHSVHKAAQEQPDYLPALALQVDADIAVGDLASAEQRARAIVGRFPTQAVGHSLLGDVAVAQKLAPQAVAAYRKAIQIQPNGDTAQRLFRVLVASDERAARSFADDWLRSHPKDLSMRRLQADNHARAGRMDVARSAYEALLERDPGDAEVMNNLVHMMLLKNDPAALRMAEQAMALRPEAPHIIGTAGWAAFKAGQTDRALQLLRDARLRDPGNANTRYFLAEVLVATGRRAEARAELLAAVQGGQGFTHAEPAQRLLSTLN